MHKISCSYYRYEVYRLLSKTMPKPTLQNSLRYTKILTKRWSVQKKKKIKLRFYEHTILQQILCIFSNFAHLFVCFDVQKVFHRIQYLVENIQISFECKIKIQRNFNIRLAKYCMCIHCNAAVQCDMFASLIKQNQNE